MEDNIRLNENEIKKLIEHDFAIKSMSSNITDLALVTKDSNIKLDKIALSMTKQELILEKLTNLEGNTKDSINRLHKRIDVNEKHITMHDERLDSLVAYTTKQNENVKSNQKRIDQLEDNNRWLTRLVIGKVIIVILGLAFILKG